MVATVVVVLPLEGGGRKLEAFGCLPSLLLLLPPPPLR